MEEQIEKFRECTYEIDLGDTIVKCYAYSIFCPPARGWVSGTEESYYFPQYELSLEYNGKTYCAKAGSETNALANLTAKIKLVKELK